MTAKVTVAAVADVHYYVNTSPNFFKGVDHRADVLLIAGDLTHSGSCLEIGPLVADINKHRGKLRKVICVLGNHDYGEGEEQIIVDHLHANDILVLGRESRIRAWSTEIRGVQFGVAGAKGFMGGFGDDDCAKFGEPLTVALIEETEREAKWLEEGLHNIRQCDARIALMHYAPAVSTVKKERAPIRGWLGSSELMKACRRGYAQVAFHGHAHRGPVRGNTDGFPLRNVALPALKDEGKAPWLLMTYANGRWSDHG